MKTNKRIVSIFSFVLALALVVPSVGGTAPVRVEAATSSSIRQEINDITDERKELQEEMEGLSNLINDNLEEIDKVVAEKNVIDQEIGLLTRDIQLLNEQIQAYALLIAEKQEELDAAEARLDAKVKENKERIRTMEENGNLSYWSVLFRANDFADLLDRLNIVQEIAAADRRRLEELRIAHAEVEQARQELEAEKAGLEEARLQLEEQQTQLALKRVEADKKLAELKKLSDQYMEKMREAEEADNALMAEIAQLEKEYSAAKAAEEAAARPQVSPGQTPPPTVTAGITWVVPCAYIIVSSPYGYRTHPVYGGGSFHDGIDLANYSGTPIVATRSGTVTIARYSSSAGYYVSINHGDGFNSVYMHMTHYIVNPGQEVTAGQIIGYMGSTGCSTGPHLHFGISYNGVSQNPAAYINFY